MKTKTLMIGLIVTAVALAPLAMAAPGDGSRGDGRHFGPRQEGGPGGGWQRGGEGGNWGPRHEGGPRGQRPRGGKGPGGSFAQMLLGRLGERLNLTDEQKEQIEGILEANKENTETAHKAVREAMKGLREAAEGGTEAEIIAAGKAVGDAFTEQAFQRANIAKQVKAVLTEEQLAQLEELKTQMKERMQQRREERRDGEGPRRQGRRGRYGQRPGHQDEPPVEN